MGWEIERDAEGTASCLWWVRDDPEAIAACRVRRKNMARRRVLPTVEEWARARGLISKDEYPSPEVVMTREEWEAEGRQRFGEDKLKWAFVCPICGHVATVQEYKDAGAPHGAVAFSCIGRWAGSKRQAFGGEGAGEVRQGPCDYAGGGLFMVNPLEVDGGRYFNFADVPEGAHAGA